MTSQVAVQDSSGSALSPVTRPSSRFFTQRRIHPFRLCTGSITGHFQFQIKICEAFSPVLLCARSNYAQSVLVSLLSRQRTQFNTGWMACTVLSPRGPLWFHAYKVQSHHTTAGEFIHPHLVTSTKQVWMAMTNDCIVSQAVLRQLPE